MLASHTSEMSGDPFILFAVGHELQLACGFLPEAGLIPARGIR